MERKAGDMQSFALDLMPSFVERVNGEEDFLKFQNKAKKYGLPMVLFFSEDRRILNEMKFLSAEFRRRVLIAQIPFTKKENKSLFFEYGVRGQALLVVPPRSTEEGGEEQSDEDKQNLVVFDGKWNLHRLQSFISEHALKSEVKLPKPAEKKEQQETQQENTKKEHVKTEL
mmetsp:Transcript_11839/g.26035  ORF Transcript_11839/g.26035 Transcript_11839/m.26035 type:complete len:171 (-) Transcript_11839:193-705(-)|eukprot:g10241.t1 g10241   contig4:1504552-1505064(+)